MSLKHSCFDFPTIEAMRNTDKVVAQRLYVVEEYSRDSSSGALYFRAEQGNGIHDGGSVINHETLEFRFEQVFNDCPNPRQFGAVSDGWGTDCTAQIKLFAAYVATLPEGSVAKFEGGFRTSQPIRFTGPHRLHLKCSTVLKPNEVRGPAVEFHGIADLKVSGKLTVIGNTQKFKHRTLEEGVSFSDCSGFDADFIEVYYTRGHAVKATNLSAIGNIKHIRAWNCGATPSGSIQKQDFRFSNRVDEGHGGNPNQSCLVDIVDYDVSNIGTEDYVLHEGSFGKEAYQIQSIDTENNRIRITPWLPTDGSADSGTFSLMKGAGLYIFGADASKITVGTLDVSGCGFGLQDRALYPATVTTLVTQYCGAGVMLSSVNAGCLGSTVLSAYFEANQFDYVSASASATKSSYIGNSVNLNLDKCFSLGAKHKKSLQRAYGNLPNTVLFSTTHGWISDKLNPYLNETLYGDELVINIMIPEAERRLFLFEMRGFVVYGSGLNGQATGSITLTVDPDFTINNDGTVSSVTYSGMDQPQRFFCKLINNNWVVTHRDI